MSVTLLPRGLQKLGGLSSHFRKLPGTALFLGREVIQAGGLDGQGPFQGLRLAAPLPEGDNHP
jgi:hypothetical protein